MLVELGSLLNAYLCGCYVAQPGEIRALTLKLPKISSIDPWKFEQAQNFGKVDESGCPMKVDLVLVVNKQSHL